MKPLNIRSGDSQLRTKRYCLGRKKIATFDPFSLLTQLVVL